jgi:competence protein ComEC
MKASSAPRQPFVGLALSAAAGIAVADFFPLGPTTVAVLVAVGALLAFVWPGSKRAYVLITACFFVLHSFQMRDSPGLDLAEEFGDRPRAINATGLVVSEARTVQNGMATFLLRLHTIAADGAEQESHATIRARWRGTVEPGDELQLFGLIGPIAPPRNPGEFDMRSYLARRDVRQELYVRYAENGAILRHTTPNPILRAAQKSRVWMEAVLSRGLENSPDAQSLVKGMALGVRHETEEDIEEPFQQTGTLHLFAVAGLHVGIVAQLLWILAMVLHLPRKWTIALIIPALFFYAAVTGLHTSSVRAAVMSAVLLAGFFAERKVFALNSLAAAAFLILSWNPNELFSLGFQLSFSVVAAIILLADPIFRFFRRWGAPDPFLPRVLLRAPRRLADTCLGWICRGASVSAAAWIGSFPLLLWDFYLITTISVLANLVIVPIAFFILGIAMLSLLVAPFLSSSLSIVFNNANWALAKAILGVVHVFAQVPGGHYYVGHPHWPSGAEAEITVLDAGAGGAVHLRSGNTNWLWDCGSERGYERLVRPYLHSRGIDRLTGLALTQADSLHIGGAINVIDDFAPAFLRDNPAPDRSQVHRRIQQELITRGLQSQPLQAGSELKLSSRVTAKILHPPAMSLGSTADDQAVVAQLIIDSRVRVLLVSDIGVVTENALCENHLDLRSDILVKGQHRTGVSGSERFLDQVKPTLIIATSRDFPETERLTDEWAEMVQSRGIKLFRQDKTGAVELRFYRQRWEASAYLTGETFVPNNRHENGTRDAAPPARRTCE